MTQDGNITRAELERLQTEQAYQADTIQALNDALSDQQIELIELRRGMHLLERRLRDALAAADETGDRRSASPEPPPPHY